MGIEESLKAMSESLGHIIGIVEDVKEIKTKLNNIERDISGYREEMIELRTNVHNFQDRFNEHRAAQVVDLDKIAASCRENVSCLDRRIDANYKEMNELNSITKRKLFDSIDEGRKQAVKDAVTEVKVWLYGAVVMAFGALIIPALKDLLKQ